MKNILFLFLICLPLTVNAATTLNWNEPQYLVNGDPIPDGYIDHYVARCKLSNGDYIIVNVTAPQTSTNLDQFITGNGMYDCGVAAVSVEGPMSEFNEVQKIFLVQSGVIINGLAPVAPGKLWVQ